MLNGIYSGGTALGVLSRQQEVISKNLAHLNTPGHRRELYIFQENGNVANDIADADPANQRLGTRIGQAATDFTEGTKKSTGRQLDVAITGEAFFTIQGAKGELYSRNGAFFRDPDGQLVNGDGLPVLDDGRPIVIPPDVSDYDLTISSEGLISANGSDFGQISLVEFDDRQLLDSTNSQIYFSIGQATAQASVDSTMRQGMREMSNAHPVTELISLMVGSRHFEAAQRAIRTISDAMQENTKS
jgi:flagellar basal body rod protein FlgG